MSIPAPLPPGSVIGILGGGQLGRMLAIAAARLGFRCHVYDPAADAPASQVAAASTVAAYDDLAALDAFAAAIDVVTLEFENIPVATLRHLAQQVPTRPGADALAVAQDRVDEKSFLNRAGIATAPWRPVHDLPSLVAALEDIGAPSILKTRRFGYDGKGQVRIAAVDGAAAAWEEIGSQPAILEGFVPFSAEVSVIAARGLGGETVAFDPGRNEHRDGILHKTTVPAGLPKRLEQDAVLTAGRILAALDYVGAMGVEMFVTDGALLVNEIAPRVHNSGHWTIEACAIDQFQQHIRAVAGWPLGDGTRHGNAEMVNLIGGDAADWQRLSTDAVGLHLYGKGEIRPGRKMGHLTRVSPLS